MQRNSHSLEIPVFVIKVDGCLLVTYIAIIIIF